VEETWSVLLKSEHGSRSRVFKAVEWVNCSHRDLTQPDRLSSALQSALQTSLDELIAVFVIHIINTCIHSVC